MDSEILSEIRNKLTAPKIAFEKLAKGEKVPREFLELAAKELKAVIDLVQELEETHDRGELRQKRIS